MKTARMILYPSTQSFFKSLKSEIQFGYKMIKIFNPFVLLTSKLEFMYD